MWEVAAYQPGRELSPETEFASPLNLDFSPPGRKENKFRSLSPQTVVILSEQLRLTATPATAKWREFSPQLWGAPVQGGGRTEEDTVPHAPLQDRTASSLASTSAQNIWGFSRSFPQAARPSCAPTMCQAHPRAELFQAVGT